MVKILNVMQFINLFDTIIYFYTYILDVFPFLFFLFISHIMNIIILFYGSPFFRVLTYLFFLLLIYKINIKYFLINIKIND